MRESQFHELYRCLGNRKKQDEIREKSENRPCFILQRDPDARACECLPKDIGEIRAGEPCPNNPYYKHADLIAAISASRWLLEAARYWADLADTGGIDHRNVLPEEWMLIRTMLEEKKREQYKLMQSGMMRVMHVKPGKGEER